ncbi:MAG: heme ABC exporter ATP-binding protein CcmA [Burkholderiaceae bacterium]|nr:heme ABC exporter ATP-binding protein CcmA [Roseateles sp.]MBV8470755.1 heme ABC exporter ATP-binding protein CcmA [Burkholderiaceae bacterium]
MAASAATTPRAPARLQAQALGLQRGGRPLFQALSFELEAGRALHLQGDNGSGKTSLLRLIAGLAPLQAGQLLWDGRRVRPQSETWRRGLLYAAHAAALKAEFTALENLRWQARLSGHAVQDKDIHDALLRLGLRDQIHTPARQLSQGQKKRLSLASLFLPLNWQLLLLDEPFDALDQASVELLKTRLGELLAQSASVIYTSHQSQSLQPDTDTVLRLERPHGPLH